MCPELKIELRAFLDVKRTYFATQDRFSLYRFGESVSFNFLGNDI